MPDLDFNAFLKPYSEQEPCGPDLDFEGDMQFMNYIARAEGVLPKSYFSFDRNSIDYSKEFATIGELCERTRDLRLLVFFAKFSILNRNLTAFADAIDTIKSALKLYWNDIHPRGEDGDFGLRVATLQSLEDAPHVIMPLSYTPLVENRRYGVVSYRARQVALGDAQPREGETYLDLPAIDRALFETDLNVIMARRDDLVRIASAVTVISETSIGFAGYQNQISLEKLQTLCEAIANFLDRHVAERDPSAALIPIETDDTDTETTTDSDAPDVDTGRTSSASDGSPSKIPTSMQKRSDAARALRVAAAYFAAYEPSSPALMLVRYAEMLMGKSFYEVVTALMPDYANRAAIFVGQNTLRLAVGQVSNNIGSYASGSFDGDGGLSDSSDDSGEDYTVHTRKDAMRLLDLVVAFFKTSEPASPIPLLISRAREVGERDFLNLMKDLFTEPTLRSIRGEDSY